MLKASGKPCSSAGHQHLAEFPLLADVLVLPQMFLNTTKLCPNHIDSMLCAIGAFGSHGLSGDRCEGGSPSGKS